MSEPAGIVLTSFNSAIERYDLGKTKLRELADDGIIETVWVGGRRLIREESLQRLAREGCPRPNKGRKRRRLEAVHAAV